MAKTWILDTETKGTGANMVPLEKALEKRSAEQDLAVVTLEAPPAPPRPAEPVEPPAPLSFRIVDVRSSLPLAEDVDARAAVEVLEGLSSVVDVRIYVWARLTGRWRLLTLEEQKTMWGFRGRSEPIVAAGAGR
jgi:hypothetical protein